MWDMRLSHWHFPAVAVADETGMIRFLKSQPADTETVAKAFSLGSRPTEVLLCLVGALGFLKRERGNWALTELAETYLVESSPCYWGGASGYQSPTFKMIKECLTKDTDQGKGIQDFCTFWSSGKLTETMVRNFLRPIHHQSIGSAMRLAENWELRGVRHVLDVGGGSGVFSTCLAKRNPGVTFTVLELPPVCPVTQEYVDREGLGDQVRVHPGDAFNDPFPAGADLVFFSDVFHDWGLEACRTLTQRSFEALNPGGRVVLHEMVLDDDKLGPVAVASFSMAMLVQTQGRQYSFPEFRDLFLSCGFSDPQVRPASGYYSLVSAAKL
jgi:SAM-dependent methyltransferase